MPNFKIEFSRTWTETDTVERVITAANAEEAAARAAEMCSEFDNTCPDDTVTSKSGTAGDWGWDDIAETDEEADDGQDPQDD